MAVFACNDEMFKIMDVKMLEVFAGIQQCKPKTFMERMSLKFEPMLNPVLLISKNEEERYLTIVAHQL
jgi:hypothetical protein